MNYAFATSKEAADIVGITPSDIGVPAINFPRKKELVATGKFDPSRLTSYTDNEFVLLKDLAQGTVTISLALNSDVTSRGTVQINGGAAGVTVSANVAIGSDVVAKCNITNSLVSVFEGWYSGATKVSSTTTYTFTATSTLSLVAKISYLEVSPKTIEFTAKGETDMNSISVVSNAEWTVS